MADLMDDPGSLSVGLIGYSTPGRYTPAMMCTDERCRCSGAGPNACLIIVDADEDPTAPGWSELTFDKMSEAVRAHIERFAGDADVTR